MEIKKRIEKLEENFLDHELDPELDRELTEWFKAHPEYQIAQPENINDPDIMPKHLKEAFQRRIVHVCRKNNVKANLCEMARLWEFIYP